MIGMSVAATMYLTFVALAIFKVEIFGYLTKKIKSGTPLCCKSQVNESLSDKQGNINQSYYLVFIMLERLINSFTLIVLNSFVGQPAIPIMLYLTFMVLACRTGYLIKAQKIRFYSTVLVGLLIQGGFLFRKISIYDEFSEASIGNSENSLSRYLPLTFAILLTITLLMTLTYFIYSIKKFRCFDLEI